MDCTNAVSAPNQMHTLQAVYQNSGNQQLQTLFSKTFDTLSHIKPAKSVNKFYSL